MALFDIRNSLDAGLGKQETHYSRRDPHYV